MEFFTRSVKSIWSQDFTNTKLGRCPVGTGIATRQGMITSRQSSVLRRRHALAPITKVASHQIRVSVVPSLFGAAVHRIFAFWLAACLLALLSAASTGAQEESQDGPNACAEMLTVLQVVDRDVRCDSAVNLQVLLNAPPLRVARKQAPVVCVPNDSEVTLQSVAELFYGYATQYHDTLYESPYVLLIEALEEEFPCRSPSEHRTSTD